MENEKEVGLVTHFFSKIDVAVIKLKDELSVGDKILFRGSTTNFDQIVESMQIERESVEKAKAGQSIGLKVKDKVRENDVVYKEISE
ncbi:MAG: translation elongation factor-like protein [Candidatus Bathyarchaeota archaeon]|jgi:putative protease|nr:translation elongation factor-like protein [Candidatus Bathyarchaeota archaeon]